MAASTSTAVTVAEIPKNRAESIRVQLREYKGRSYADLRTYYLAESDGPEDDWLPTKKGISLGAEKLPELLAAVEALVAAASEEPPC